MDNFKINARYYIHGLKPDGFSYKFSHVNLKDVLMPGESDPNGPEARVITQLLMDEPETAARLYKAFSHGEKGEPKIFSEAMPYIGYYNLRGGWEPDSDFLHFQSFPVPDSGGRQDINGFELHALGARQLLVPSIVVDGRTQNLNYGMVYDPGGKTNYLAYDNSGKPAPHRFHTSATFDLAEGIYAGVYQYHNENAFADVYGDYGYLKDDQKHQAAAAKAGKPFSNDPLRDVKHVRQILSVRGQDLYIVTDRIIATGPHQYTQHYTLFTPVPQEGWRENVERSKSENHQRVIVDQKGQSVRSDNRDLPGVSIYDFAAQDVAYKVTSDDVDKVLKKDARTVEDALRSLGSSKNVKWFRKEPIPFSQKIRTDWKVAGNSVRVWAISPHSVSDDLKIIQSRRGEEGAVGFDAVTRDGTQVMYSAAAKPDCILHASGIEMSGEALLAATQSDGTLRGIALGCRKISVGGNEIKVDAEDFEFEMAGTSLKVLAPIHRPIDPVTIRPDVNVFTDSIDIEMASATPGVEIRYTLDGTDPTPATKLYTCPVHLADSAVVKARAFRPGVKEVPWSEEGTLATVVTLARFDKQRPLAAVQPITIRPGLEYEYMEGPWTTLMTYADRLPSKSSGSAADLFDISMRQTDGAFAMRYTGFIDVPADGVYTFYCPHEFNFPDNESGYDLRVIVNGHPWYPATSRHAHGTWSIALAKGLHSLEVIFTDYRPKKLKPELWNHFPHPDVVWKGIAPMLEVSGPGINRTAISREWLKR